MHFGTILLICGSSIFHRQKLTKFKHIRVLLPVQFHHSYCFQFPVFYFQFWHFWRSTKKRSSCYGWTQSVLYLDLLFSHKVTYNLETAHKKNKKWLFKHQTTRITLRYQRRASCHSLTENVCTHNFHDVTHMFLCTRLLVRCYLHIPPKPLFCFLGPT